MRTRNVLWLLALPALLAGMAAAAPAARALEPGDAAPPLTAKDWINATRPVNLAEQQGKVVAILFFQTTAPEMAKFALMYVDMEKEFKDRGFLVIGVSRENKDLLMNWADETKVTFPIAAADRQAWEKDYLITGHPFVYVIGIYGEIAYKGDGNYLKEVKPEIEKCLGEVKRVNLKREETGKTFDKVWRALDSTDFPNAIKFLLAIQNGQNEDEKVTAGKFLDDVRSIADARLKRAAGLEKRFDYLGAQALLKGVEKSFVGLDQAKKAKESLARFEKDAKIQLELRAQRAFEQGRALEEQREFQRAGDIFRAVTGMGVTYAGRKAQAHLNDLIRRKVYRPQ